MIIPILKEVHIPNVDKIDILYFFHDLVDLAIRIPSKPGWGNACSHLLSDLILRQVTFLSKVLANDGDFHEYRLNGAGLKIHWRIKRKQRFEDDNSDNPPIETAKFQCYISGDQAKEYPEFVKEATEYIRRRGFSHR